jgi:hypothetical protein
MSSGFFDTALKKEWKEGQEQDVKLPETEVEIFEIYVKWLYTGRVFLAKEGDVISSGKGSNEWPRWYFCYALGDFLQDCDFKDACIDTCIEAMCDMAKIPTGLSKWIYPYSTPTSAHRRFVVDTFVNCRNRATWTDDVYNPAEFLTDVVKPIGPKLKLGLECEPVDEYLDPNYTCKYHDHGPEKPCYKTKPAFSF